MQTDQALKQSTLNKILYGLTKWRVDKMVQRQLQQLQVLKIEIMKVNGDIESHTESLDWFVVTGNWKQDNKKVKAGNTN